jgi:curli biogenesis system outer membrane secretion channel CsgG
LPVRRSNIEKIVLVILGFLILSSASNVLALEKPRIGVLRFTNNTHAYWWPPGTASDLQDMLINELIATKAFHVLERPEIYSLLEQKFTEAVAVDTKTKPKTGKYRGARYLIVAAVSAFEENTNGNGSRISFFNRFSGEEQKKALVVIDVRVIDADTGTVTDSRSIEANTAYGEAAKTSHSGNPAVFGSTLSKQDKTPVGCAIRNCITDIAEYLECSLITKDAECIKKYAATGTKRKEKYKAVIQLGE